MRCQRYKYLLSFGWHNPKRSKLFNVINKNKTILRILNSMSLLTYSEK